MSSSLPGLDWEESAAHLTFLASFLEPRLAGDSSSNVDWQQLLEEEPNQVIRRFLAAGVLEHDDLRPHLARLTVARLRGALRERELPVGGRKDELIARLLEADADGLRESMADQVLLRCSKLGQQVLERSREQEADVTAGQEVALEEHEGAAIAEPAPPSQEEAESQGQTRQLNLSDVMRSVWAWTRALAIGVWLWMRKVAGVVAEKVRGLGLGARSRAAWCWVKESANRVYQRLQSAIGPVERRETTEMQTGPEQERPVIAMTTEVFGTAETVAEPERAGLSSVPAAAQPDAAGASTHLEGMAEAMGDRPDSALLEEQRGQPSANVWMVLGERDLTAGEYRQAVVDFGKAIEVDPECAAAYASRGSALAHLGEWEAAIADYDRAIGLEPQSAELCHDRGVAYERMGDYQRALDSYRQAIALHPGFAQAYCGCGTAYRWLNDAPRALENYSKAIELDPRLAIAYSGSGDICYVLGDYVRAIAEYDRAIRLDRTYAEAYHNRGLAYEQLGDYRRAAADYRMVRDLARDADLQEWVEERLQEVLSKLW